GDVPGFMPAMTMPFTARAASEIAGVKPGDAITFTLFVTSDDSWIGQIRPVDPASLSTETTKPPAPLGTNVPRLKEGDELPAFALVDQAGGEISPATFAGRNLLLTFIYTRCAVPNFCPLMSRNFDELEKEIQQDPALAEMTRLL